MAEQRQTYMAGNRIVGPAAPRPAVSAETLTPKDVLGILRRHVFLIVSLTILGFIFGGVSWYLLLTYFPRYTAETQIRILQPGQQDPMIIGGQMATKDILYGYRLSIATLIRQQSTLLDLLALDKVQKTKWFQHFGNIKEVRIRKAFKDLIKHFDVSPDKDSEFVRLAMTCGDKEEAAAIVNEMQNLFLASQGTAKRGEAADRLAKLEDQRVRVQRDLKAADDALDDVRKSSKFTDLDVHQFMPAIDSKLQDLEINQNKLVQDIQQIQANVGNLEKQAMGPINEQIENEIERDPVMLDLASRIATLESEIAGTLTKFGENHRLVRQTQELLKEYKEKRRVRKAEIAEQTRQANLKNTQDQLVVLMSRLAELEKMRQDTLMKKAEYDVARVQYEQRIAIRDERKQMLDSMKEQIEKQKIILDSPETSKVQFVGLALPPLEISSPRWEVYFPGGTILGLMLGAGLALLIELLNDTVRTPRDVARYLHIPLLGIIPNAEEDEQVHDINLYHIVRQAPYSITSEFYRRFRTNLKLSDSSASSRVLLISSGAAGDGKTSVAVNLATAIIAEGKKVLLVDANLRRPNLNKIFPRAQTPADAAGSPEFGLSNFLMGQCRAEDIIRTGGMEGLDVVDSGQLLPNPAELLGSVQMEQFVRQQKDKYDYVIIDGPPVLLLSDAKILARLVDGTILVFNAGTTRRGAALRTIGEMKEVNAVIAGCVLFAVKAIKGGYFHEQFKSYQKYQELQLAHAT